MEDRRLKKEPFEAGCEVECVKSKNLFPLLQIYNKYYVYKVAFNGAAIYLHGISENLGPFNSERFRVVTPTYDFEFSDGWDHTGATEH